MGDTLTSTSSRIDTRTLLITCWLLMQRFWKDTPNWSIMSRRESNYQVNRAMFVNQWIPQNQWMTRRTNLKHRKKPHIENPRMLLKISVLKSQLVLPKPEWRSQNPLPLTLQRKKNKRKFPSLECTSRRMEDLAIWNQLKKEGGRKLWYSIWTKPSFIPSLRRELTQTFSLTLRLKERCTGSTYSSDLG